MLLSLFCEFPNRTVGFTVFLELSEEVGVRGEFGVALGEGAFLELGVIALMVQGISYVVCGVWSLGGQLGVQTLKSSSGSGMR